MSEYSQEYQRGFADGRHSKRDELATVQRERDEALARIAVINEALAVASFILPEMEVDVVNPKSMMLQVQEHVKKSEAERDTLRTQLEAAISTTPAGTGMVCLGIDRRTCEELNLRDGLSAHVANCRLGQLVETLRTNLDLALGEVEQKHSALEEFGGHDYGDHPQACHMDCIDPHCTCGFKEACEVPAQVAALLAARTPKPVHSPDCATNRVGWTTRPVCDCGIEKEAAQ